MPQPPYRTIVYVDGFNFYYGAVRGTGPEGKVDLGIFVYHIVWTPS